MKVRSGIYIKAPHTAAVEKMRGHNCDPFGVADVPDVKTVIIVHEDDAASNLVVINSRAVGVARVCSSILGIRDNCPETVRSRQELEDV